MENVFHSLRFFYKSIYVSTPFCRPFRSLYQQQDWGLCQADTGGDENNKEKTEWKIICNFASINLHLCHGIQVWQPDNKSEESLLPALQRQCKRTLCNLSPNCQLSIVNCQLDLHLLRQREILRDRPKRYLASLGFLLFAQPSTNKFDLAFVKQNQRIRHCKDNKFIYMSVGPRICLYDASMMSWLIHFSLLTIHSFPTRPAMKSNSS